MFDQATANSTQSSLTSAHRPKRSTKTSRKSSAADKSTADDWPAAIRQGFGAGLAMLGEYLLQAGQDLSQTKAASRRRK